MGWFFNKKNAKTKVNRFDFDDYWSKGVTPSRFGDTRPQFVVDSHDYDLLNNMYQENGLAQKVVRKPAEDMTRNGWRIVIPDDPNRQAIYQKAMDNLHLTTQLKKELIYMRLHGDGYANIGLKEIKPSSESDKVDFKNIKNVSFVHAFGQKHVQKTKANDDPTDINYGQEQQIFIKPTTAGSTINKYGFAMPQQPQNYQVIIDKSRYFHVDIGKLEDNDLGTSVLTTCGDPLKVLNSGLYSDGKILYEYTLKIFQSSRIRDMEGNPKERAKAQAILNQGMSTESVFAIGDNETMTKLGTNVGGIDKLYEFAWQQLAAASDIPKSVLMGQEAGTLAGAQYDVINYYDGIKAKQETILKPQIEYIVKLLMYSTDVAGGFDDPDKIDWHIEFNPLWTADDVTQSKTLLQNAQAANALVSAGILDPDEAKQMLGGQHNSVSAKTDSADKQLTEKEIEKMRQQLISFIHGDAQDDKKQEAD
ncbi:hypothetical protein SAMN04487792_1545 [Lactobacillus bombicola]|uniref:Anti-CBASS protein Acb1-like N-terminal domain-containing protein n=1 Tax=Lactobacillus bombicola TaxID=1505723 RepID=A0A1I1TPL4_9LACO|nr:anti-CBASS Acb1 family protein [Lactobacillus bombicola]SFD60507.1 hypothetical protein SAMN04487792_1545 [Lactobacillus bombicola]